MPAPGNSFVTRSEPLGQATRITGTPRISLMAEQRSNVMIKLYDVAPDGTAVMFDEQVSVLTSGETALDLRSPDWTLPAGHSLAVEIGTISPDAGPVPPTFGPGGDWLATPSLETIEVTEATLALALNDPAVDTATAGVRSTYLDIYLAQRTKNLPVGSVTFTLPPGAAR